MGVRVRVGRAAALTWRLGRQLLHPPGSGGAVEVVDALGAVASQLRPVWAERGVRLRSTTAAEGDVDRAVLDGTLLRTFTLRGALHLMTPAGAAGHLALRASGRMWERRSWREFYRLDPDDWSGLRAAVREALANGPLTRAELGAAVAAHPPYAHLATAFTDDSATFVKPFAWFGDLTAGPVRDGAMTLRLLDGDPRWSGLLPVEEAGVRAVTAYLRAYGPASAANLAYWLSEGLGVRRAQVTRWLEAAGDGIRAVDVEGEERLVLAEDLDGLLTTAPARTVHLLPHYDQWVLGPGTADAFVVPAALRPDVSRGAHLLVVDGAVTGTWALVGEHVEVRRAPGTDPGEPEAWRTAVARLGAVVGRELVPGQAQ